MPLKSSLPTPKNVIEALNAAVVSALADPAPGLRIGSRARDIPPGSADARGLGARYKAKIEKWWWLIKDANIKGE